MTTRLKLHFKRNKGKKFEERHAQLLAGYQMTRLLRKKRTSELVEIQHANQHCHQLSARYKKQYHYVRAQLYRVTVMVERLTQTSQWVSASEHHYIHSSRKHWVTALCKIRYMLHQCQEHMSLFAKQINDHIAHLTGLDNALATFLAQLYQFHQAHAPFISDRLRSNYHRIHNSYGRGLQ